MDYQRACGCRMGRGYAQPIYRTVEMNNAHLKQCPSDGARMDVQRIEDHADCCNDRDQHYPSLAIVTSPSQVWQKLFSPCDAMAHGTLFCALYKPLVGCKTGGRMR